jgi:hypothetical protein
MIPSVRAVEDREATVISQFLHKHVKCEFFIDVAVVITVFGDAV